MATLIDIPTGRLGYVEIVNTVRRRGRERAPRGLKTYDLGHCVIRVASPYDALPLGTGRRLNLAIGAAEATQLIAGRATHALLPSITGEFVKYTEDTGRFHGAYGDRVTTQVASAIEKIKADPDTRQAIVTLWDPTLDNTPGKRDYPCTVALNFVLINNFLELRTLMRSNDVWLGLPYDIFQFTQLQLTVARALGVEPGYYTHTAWSLHLYHEHAELVDQLAEPVTEPLYRWIAGFGRPGDGWEHCQLRARAILNDVHPHVVHEDSMTESERWYARQLAPYTGFTPRTTYVG